MALMACSRLRLGQCGRCYSQDRLIYFHTESRVASCLMVRPVGLT